MANHKSAIKRARQNTKKRSHNRSRKSAVRTAIKALKAAVQEGNKESVSDLFITAQSRLGKLAKSSAIKKKTAARLTSRLAKTINKIA